ncbi:hypothetical protein Dda_1979 [Drechslerella dactyloides]|uniref:Uncharacterized protein n=1 Tax=Drechslerella dactyloides TaxID=74499 RepID=A0AAD6J6X2_DREDA|nr:hypothetical protein Dda_1979 [Drechslerella dactyloides]
MSTPRRHRSTSGSLAALPTTLNSVSRPGLRSASTSSSAPNVTSPAARPTSISAMSSSATSSALEAESWPQTAVNRIRSLSFGAGLRHYSLPEDEDQFLEMLDDFLADLEERLDRFEKHLDEYRTFGTETLDHQLEITYTTLSTIRSECSRVSDEMVARGRRKARLIVDILESRYNDALIATGALESDVTTRAKAALAFLSEMVVEFDARAQASMDRKLMRAKLKIEQAVGGASELAESIERAITKAREGNLLYYADLPTPWKVNSYILSGYRFSEKKLDCVLSAFTHIHNETCNIWTHLLGFVGVLTLAFYLYPSSTLFAQHTTADRYINALFFVAAAKALACSTIWHTMSSIAELSTMERFACVDYTGISLLVAASILTVEYAAFYNEPRSRTLYMSFTVILGTVGVIFPWRPIFNRTDYRGFRVMFYVCLGASGFLPLAQLLYTRGAAWCIGFYLPLLRSLAVYLMGATVYAYRIPERWWPGMFDLIGGSHNLWHLAVVGGVWFHWMALQQMFLDAFERAELLAMPVA